MKELLLEFLLLAYVSILCFVTADVLSIALPQSWRLLDRKPFNCQPCLSFHLIFMFGLIFSLLLNSYFVFIGSVIAAAGVFGLSKLINDKYIKP